MTRLLLPLIASLLLSGSAIAAPAASASAAASAASSAASASAAQSIAASASSASVAASPASSAVSVSAAVSTDAASASAAASTALVSPSAGARPPASGSAPPLPDTTVALASDDPNDLLWQPDSDIIPTGQRGQLGANVIGPQNVPIDLQNADLLAPPTTDHGEIPNAKWPFSLSHNRLQTGGWAREQNVNAMPIATSIAGVNMRLEAGSIRELHWHKTSEWAFILKGSVQITAVNSDGQNFIGTVNPGDLWFFPAGMPHSLQATAASPDGAEFLLVFPDGGFSEDSTFLLTDWLAHVPKEVIAKNFQTSISAFDHLVDQELYIFPSTPPPPNEQPPKSPQGTIPDPFTFAFSKVKPTQFSGGTFKPVDSTLFKASTEISAAEVTVEPGAMRELHWHPTQDEWSYFISGQGRVTIHAGTSAARTFDYEAGDVGFVPASMGHYVENTGNTTLHYLEIFNSDRVQDVSLSQWLALTPPELVQKHLDLPQDVLDKLTNNFKTKAVVVGPQ
ncbi:Bicupin, oxalate decarboxylase/oxidase [Lentinus tigrinus ALCF2SS1-7]|uniref:Bicupin, oxalate decarboxylase/oxidase n=1 Tax=Lentinus tigrinus ALCF2SS1-7 TaxID=1328758 RepID=UPI001165D99D|nr:Bicupin, oxalate decarboxylase/oxidase [Lentinus tigrinus ALCF2SS1-7]